MFGHGPANVAVIEAEREVGFLLGALVAALNPRYVIETGTYHGFTARCMAENLAVGWLDTMETDSYSVGIATEALVGLPATVHQGDSLDFTPDRPVDFAFLDSGIGDQRLFELSHFEPFLAPTATVAIHDAKSLALEIPPGWRCVNLHTPLGLLLLQAT